MTAPHPVLPGRYADHAERRRYVRRLFDTTARHYDRLERLLSFGSGSWYRRRALRRAGVGPGARVLDVAAGTGLVAREARSLGASVAALDASARMLASGSRVVPRVQAVAEALPFHDARFDFVTMGYALRHVSDLDALFAECRRVLRPGGTLLLLEMTRPRGRVRASLLASWFGRVMPALARWTTRDPDAATLLRYYWETVEACASPAAILAALERAGLHDARRQVELGIFSAYAAKRTGCGTIGA